MFVIILCAKKIVNNASNANAVYRQSTRYSYLTEESWACIGLEFGVQSVGVFTAQYTGITDRHSLSFIFIIIIINRFV